MLFHRFEEREELIYYSIHHTFCDTVDPLQLSDYLFEENCLTLTDLVCNINNKTVRYVIFIVDFRLFFPPI